MNFRDWLEQQESRSDGVGLLARSVDWPEDGDHLGTFERHLLEEQLDLSDRDVFLARRTSEPAMRVLRRAWREWRSAR